MTMLRWYSAKMQGESIEQQLRKLETRLLQPATRHDPDALLGLLAEEFCEFGSSGHVYSRSEIVNALQAESLRHFSITDFSITTLCDGVALVRYQATLSEPEKEISKSLRSSIWVLRDSRWQMLFHQGTRIGA
jgi:hypothetical protein